MWTYNYSDELYHHGVKGMKWGHRTAHPVSETRAAFDSAKSEKKSAVKAYNKALLYAVDKASANPATGWTKKEQKKWENVGDKAKALGEANENFNSAKAKRTKAIDAAQAKVDKETPILKKGGWMYSEATNRKAAQYVVDHNMSISEARKKARGDAWKKSAILLGTYGTISYVTVKAALK